MSDEAEQFKEPITVWLRLLEGGKPEAAQPLWEHYCQKLMSLAYKQLSAKLRQSYDEEDAALSAFHSMCRVIADGRQSDLSSRENLWRLLVTITERKVLARVRHEVCIKRDIRRTITESTLVATNPLSSDLDRLQAGLDYLPSREPTPEFAAEFAETFNCLFDALGSEELQKIVQLRMLNHTNAEIGEKMGVTRRTVERKLLIIQARWQQLAD